MGKFLGMLPAGNEAVNKDTVTGKLGHLVSQAETARLRVQTSDSRFRLRAPPAAQITDNLPISIAYSHYLLIISYFETSNPLLFPSNFVAIIFPFPCATCRRGGTDYVLGQKQAGQEAGQRHPERGSSSSAGLVLLHRPRRHDEEAARDPDFHQRHQGQCVVNTRPPMKHTSTTSGGSLYACFKECIVCND